MYLVVLIITVLILSKRGTPSSQPSPLPDLPWSLGEVALVFIVIEWVQNLVVGGFAAVAGAKARELGEVFSIPVAFAGLCTFFFFSIGSQRTISSFGLNHRMGGLQVLFGIRWTLFYLTSVLMLVIGILGSESLIQGKLFQRVQHQWEVWGWSGFLLQFLAEALAGSTLEEFMFRGLLYGTIRQKISMWPAILITSIVFMLAHGINSYGMFFIGIFSCLLVEKSHSLLPAIAAHISHNFFVSALTIPLILSVPSSIYVYFLGMSLSGIVGICFIEVWIRKRRKLSLRWDFVWSVPR
ncbi:MAG: CPBP family intramembrane glutamic endopeptidase [Candidatus Manganitrophaceae bacterium]